MKIIMEFVPKTLFSFTFLSVYILKINQKSRQWKVSDREGHGHKAVVYKSHFPPLRHSVVTETPARYLTNKPRLHQRPSSLFFMPLQHGGSSDLTEISGLLALDVFPIANQLEGWKEPLRDLPFHTPIAGSFLHAEQMYL